jgi:Methyltransferase domain
MQTEARSSGAIAGGTRYRHAVQFIKRIHQRLAPGLYKTLRYRWGHPATMVQISKVVSGTNPGKVQSGPFEGMVCESTVSGNHVPKVMGIYELELHDIMEQIVQTDYPLVIDVGCGEGYYLVGLARRMVSAKFIGFDIDPEARAAAIDQARLNGVLDRVTVNGKCDPEILQTVLRPGSLVISDCEGYEMELFQPDLVPALSRCDMLIEMHEMFSPGVTAALRERFEPTHEIHLVDTVDRDPKLYPALNSLSPKQQRLAVDESRCDLMQWAWMRAKAR